MAAERIKRKVLIKVNNTLLMERKHKI